MVDLNETIKKNKRLQEENKELSREIARLRGAMAVLINQLDELQEPVAQPHYPCLECHDTGLVREWKTEGKGVEELPCPKGCELKELHRVDI